MKNEKNEVYLSSGSSNLIKSGEIQPCEALKEYIECYWYLIANAKLILPVNISITADGTFGMIFNLSQNKKSNFIKIHGIPESGTSIVASDNAYILGIKFLPGSILSFFDIHASEFCSTPISLSDIIGTRADELHEKLMLIDGLQGRINFLESYLVRTLHQRKLNVPETIGKIKLELGRGTLVNAEIINDLGCVCERQIRRLFAQYIGVGPKEFVRMLRVQNAIHLLAMKKDISFKELAIITGHYDQSHFIKEFRKFTGITPSHFKKQLNLA